MEEYTIPNNTRIGHVHLKVSDLDRALAFYCDLLGFELITTYGKEAAFISAVNKIAVSYMDLGIFP